MVSSDKRHISLIEKLPVLILKKKNKKLFDLEENTEGHILPKEQFVGLCIALKQTDSAQSSGDSKSKLEALQMLSAGSCRAVKTFTVISCVFYIEQVF